MTTEQLIHLKNKIEKGKNKLAELIGAEKSQLQALAKEYNLQGIDEAEAAIEQGTADIEKKTAKINKLVEKLKDEYPILFK